MSYTSPDPRWTRLELDRPAPVERSSGPAIGGPILPLLRQIVAEEPVDYPALLDHIATAIHETEPVYAPRAELLALLDLPDVTEPSLSRDAALARVDELRSSPEEHAELVGALALAVALPATADVVSPGSALMPSVVGLVCTALRVDPPVRSVKEAYQHARGARSALTAELAADGSSSDSVLRVLLRLFVLRRWLLETTWPQRRVCWRLLDKVTVALCPPVDSVTLARLTEQLEEYQFRRWPS